MDIVVVKLRKMMEERNWSEYRLAKEASLPQSTVANIFHRNTLPSIPTLKILCDAFGISLGEFFMELQQEEITDQETSFLRDWNKLSNKQRQLIQDLMNEFLSQS